MHSHLYLASQSPRRQALLEQLGVRCKPLLADADEDAEALEAVLEGESPAAYVQRVCALKAEAALARLRRRGLPFAPILTADTTVAAGAQILGKPADAEDAARMLGLLGGTRHQVLTAVALVTADGLQQGLSTSTVTLRPLRDEEIRRYIASGEPFGKAGAYAVQGRAAEFITHIDGSYSGIMGLPLAETATLLRSAQVAF